MLPPSMAKSGPRHRLDRGFAERACTLERGPGCLQTALQARAEFIAKLKQPKAQQYLRYSSLGLQFAAVVGLPVAFGLWLDNTLETSPWFLLTGGAFGGVAGIYQLIRTVFPGGLNSQPSSDSSVQSNDGNGGVAKEVSIAPPEEDDDV